MNFLFKIGLMFASSVYVFATCSSIETNATNSLRLAHSVCPKLFTPHPDKEKSTITFYKNSHNMGTNGRDITITVNLDKTFTQPWITSLTTTLVNLKNQINADGEFKATSTATSLTIEAMESGYKVDAVAMGGTPQEGEYNMTTGEGNLTSAELNVTATTALREGANGIAEQVSWDFNGTDPISSTDINFSTTGIKNIRLYVNGVPSPNTGTDYSSVTTTFNQLLTRLQVLDNGLATITGVPATGVINATSLISGARTSMEITLEHNASGSYTGIANIKSRGGTKTIVQAGVNPIASSRRLYYYGNEGNYSIKFWPGTNAVIGNNSDSNITTIETPYLGTMTATLNYLDRMIDANGTYTSVPTSLSPDYGYLTLTDRTPSVTNHRLSGKSGNGRPKINTTVQGKATPEDINMTYISYNDSFLYTTFDVDYDINESDGNYSSAKQDILEIFEVSHIDATGNMALNTIDLTSAVVLRHDDNVSSVVSANDIVFLGDNNSSYFKFTKTGATKTLTNMEKLEEPNEIENVQANVNEHYQDGDNAYVFLADDTRMRVYKVDSSNKVTHYVTFYNFGGLISDINRDGQYLYVQSNEGNRLTKFLIVSENNRFSIERAKTFYLDANKIFVRGKFIYYTVGSGDEMDYGMQAKIGDSMIENEETVENDMVSFMIGDEFYSASVGMDGLKIYDFNRSLNSVDNAYSGSRILLLGEFIITDDLNSSQIRVYRFGDVSISSREGEGSISKPFYLDMMANKINIEDVNWSIQKNASHNKINLRQKRPSYPFTDSGLWFIEAVVTYKNYKFPSVYRYRFNVIEDNAPGVEINASSIRGLKGLNVDFTSIITKNSYVDYIMWDFNDTNKSTFIPATSTMRNPSWKFEDQGDYNVSFVVYYDRDKNVTKNIMIHISSPLEMNTTNVDGNNTNTHIKGDDINFSANILDNEDFYTMQDVGGVPTKVPVPTKTYTWSFGDRDMTVSYLESPLFAYKEAGTYVVTLEIIKEDSNGNDIKYTSKKTISIVNFEKPSIIADKLSGETPLKVNFNVSLKGYLVKNIRPISISWTFTGGGVSSKQNPTFTFENPATNGYVVMAKVELSDGKTLELEKTIMVSDKVDLKIEANALAGYSPLTVNLVATGSSFEGINRYEWMIGLAGEEKIKKTGTSLEHTFDSNGTYEINATAFSNKDHNGTANLSIIVNKGPDIVLKGELVNADDETELKFTASKNDGATGETNTSWLINDVEMETNKDTFTYKFLESKGYKVEFKVILATGDIVKYVYDRNPSFNPYVKKVQIYTGWNLMSSPLDEKFIDIADGDVPHYGTDNLNRLKDISSIIWTFSGNTWHKNPTEIANKLGFWIKATMNKELIFDGNTPYEPDITRTPLVSGLWYLRGTGKKLTNYNSSGIIEVVWMYKKGKWYKNPIEINPGDGFWIKAQ